MELLIQLLSWFCLCAAALLAAAVLPLIAWLFFGKRKAFLRLLCVCLAVELLGLAYLTGHPLYTCPEEYQACVSEEERQSILGVSRGLYSERLPLVPCVVAVQYADGDSIVFTTYYLPFGSVQTELTADGFSRIRGLEGV